MVDLTIRFATEEQALAFATWLCEAGEQDYWMWGEIAVKHPIRAAPPEEYVGHFDYHNNGQEFCKDLVIRSRGVMFNEDKPLDGPKYCKNCKGHGVTDWHYPEPICPVCNGSGLANMKGEQHDTRGTKKCSG